MNTAINKQELMTRRPTPSSEATQIEQARAIAQVQGALIVAQQRPRDEIRARERMESACQVEALAEHAFFRYSRGGSQITGPSIHLATELARCWGNVDYGITELRRDDHKGESEMMSYAWDLETNNRVTNSFIVPHKRDKKSGPEALIDMRDIYENNANAAARRLRECIFRVLPKSFLEEAKELCGQTLEHGGGVPLEQRRTALLEAFAALGVTRKQVETKIGRAADRLSAYDIGVLRVVYGSIRRGETTAADEFADDTAAEIGTELKKSNAGSGRVSAGHTGNGDGAGKKDDGPDAPAKDKTMGDGATAHGSRSAESAQTDPATGGTAREAPMPEDRPGKVNGPAASPAKPAAAPGKGTIARTSEEWQQFRGSVEADFATMNTVDALDAYMDSLRDDLAAASKFTATKISAAYSARREQLTTTQP